MANKIGAESDQELDSQDNEQIGSESGLQPETTLDVEPTVKDKPPSRLKRFLRACGKKYEQQQEFCSKYRKNIYRIVLIILLTGYFCMVIAACVLNFTRALGLLVLTLLAIFFYLWDMLIAKYEAKIGEKFASWCGFFNRQGSLFKILLYTAIIVFIILWLALDTAREGANQLISFVGLLLFVILLFIFSKYPEKVKWRTVFWGIGLQFIFGLLILRTKAGFTAFEWMGIQVQIFLNYTDAGSRFLFGEAYTNHFFAFKVLPIVIFFSTVISILYYLGFIQWLILKIGWIMQISMNTTPAESLVAAGNIFVGQTESPLLIRPYIEALTRSELHSVMTSGFATIAGSVLGAYISFGVPAPHLLTASVMSAPAALAVSKLFWPETEIPRISTKSNIKLDRGEAMNIIEAACLGAFTSVALVANIAVNLIAFLALLAFLNAVLSWLGNMFNEPGLSFELICSYVFMPVAFMMGVDWNDSFMVGELIGVKTFFNEFVAYERLTVLINKRIEGKLEYVDGTKQYLSVRSEAIVTYALCGFANFGSVGIVIGGLSSLAPSRLRDIASVSVRALIAGTVASFMTACIAGILYKSPTDALIACPIFLTNSFNTSSLPVKSPHFIECCMDLFKKLKLELRQTNWIGHLLSLGRTLVGSVKIH
ncbi:solute carrier family 28 member 3-like isoform X2 [Scyliorhinus canicula]|uniref:solute carrier family 28 member 3-like isoform X2 n=1 Tax=Scyliorhinus canicula TaxID=7830 RepID=UPI0018F64A43|nr:solute carrier family 28 member 3-like isoform X2 [Scyliorhinus canicula]